MSTQTKVPDFEMFAEYNEKFEKTLNYKNLKKTLEKLI